MRLVHCSYHKCLTSLYQLVFRNYFASAGRAERYIHFKSEIDQFARYSKNFELSSINNHYLDPAEFPNIRISRFIRDPRDLVVSGYFYHKSGSEPWTRIRYPTLSDWGSVNGDIPGNIEKGESFAEMLTRVPREEGLIAEIDFRARHFQSMREWDGHDERVLLLKYEDFVGDEIAMFKQLLRYYEFADEQCDAVMRFVNKHSIKNQRGGNVHIRNPDPSQWREVFTPKVESYFNARYADLLEKYEY